MGHLFIKDIKPGLPINETYMVTQPVLRNTAKGDLYIAMFLSDRTGKVNSRMWQATETIYNQLPSEGFVQIRGKSELYQNSLQIVINDIVVVNVDKVNLADYMPRTEKDVKLMYQELRTMLLNIRDTGLNALINEFFADNDLMRQFCTAPAAMQMHHSYLGGLLEHTHSMMKVATAVLPNYPKIQADLVLAAVFLHDIAKTKELSYSMGFSYTDTGQLIGHLVLGVEMINAKAAIAAQKGMPVGKAVMDNLLHIILSHHGCYEFGSPKLPATAEAFMVSYIDDLDAKMNQVTTLIDTDPGDTNWTAFQRPLETKLYRPRPLAGQ